MNLIRNLSIRTKLQLILAVAIIGIALTSAVSLTQFGKLNDLQQLQYQAKTLDAQLLMLRRHEKDFLARKDLKYADKFEQTATELQKTNQQMSDQLKNFPQAASFAESTVTHIDQYEQTFRTLVDLEKQIGLDHKQGLYGALRDSVHGIEDVVKTAESYELLYHMLMLRRHEKDFMLRRLPKYMDKFNAQITSFEDTLALSDIPNQDIIRDKLQSYQKQFTQFYDFENKVGLTAKEGILGAMRNSAHDAEASFSELSTHLDELISTQQSSTTNMLIAATVIVLIAIAALINLVARAVYLPVQCITKIIEECSQNRDLTVKTQYSGQDEIGKLSRAFDNLIETLNNTIGDIRNCANETTSSADSMTLITHRVGEASANQQAQVEQTVTAMTEMSATIGEVAQNASLAANSVKDIHKLVEHGKSLSDDARIDIETLNSEIEGATAAIEKLQKDSESIGSILSEINAIAEQTNLLALNAAIEAARAGEQGRGFAVVADEVRTLASRTQESTESIRTTICEFNKGTEEVVQTVLKSRTRAETGINKVRETSSSLQEIYSNMSNISDLNIQIATASEEQSQTSGEINRNVLEINELAGITKTQANEAARNGEELRRMAERLTQSVAQFK